MAILAKNCAGVIPKAFFQNLRNDVSFTHRLTLDIGASDPKGSVKILAQTDDGKDLFEKSGGYLGTNQEGFDSEDNFMDCLAQVVIDASKKAKELIRQQGLGNKEEKLSKLALFLPGPIGNDEAILIANLKNSQKKQSLTNIDLSKIPEKLRNNTEDVELSENFKFIPTKDLAGTGIGIAKILVNHPDFKDKFTEGFYVVGVMTGGGFGSVDIEVFDKKNVKIETSECSHDLAIDSENKTITRLGKLGATSKGVIENFVRTIGINDQEEIDALVKTGKATIATQDSVDLNKKEHLIAINALKKTGMYKITSKGQDKVTLSLKKDSPEAVTKFIAARKEAIDDYADTVAQHAITKINRQANLMVLTGPLALGINKTVMDNSAEFDGASSLRDLIMKKIDDYVGNDLTCKKLREYCKFDIVCRDDINLPNNTLGGSVLLDDRTKVVERRGDWIILSRKALKNKAEIQETSDIPSKPDKIALK